MDYISVRIGRLPGTIQNVVLNGGRTVKDAFEAASLDPTGYSVYVNDVLSNMSTTVKSGDMILAAKQIKGN